MEYLVFEKRDNIGILKFNNPKSLNALSSEILFDLQQLLIELSSDKSIRILIVTGEGKAFIAGADIKEMQNMNPQQAKEFSLLGNSVLKLIETFPIPVIAAVNGFALGGGLEVVLVCDFAYASKIAKFGFPELGLGLIPGFSGCKRLSDLIGLKMAKELIFTARMIDAEESLRLKIINKITEPEELIDVAIKTAESIINVSPNAVREVKDLLNSCSWCSGEVATAIESNKFGLIFSHPDAKNGMAAFIEKTRPIWEEIK